MHEPERAVSAIGAPSFAKAGGRGRLPVRSDGERVGVSPTIGCGGTESTGAGGVPRPPPLRQFGGPYFLRVRTPRRSRDASAPARRSIDDANATDIGGRMFSGTHVGRAGSGKFGRIFEIC